MAMSEARTTPPPKRRPLDRRNRRVTVEVYPEDEPLWHRVRVAAVEARVTLREWITETVRERLDRES
jgi:hypothetical protein